MKKVIDRIKELLDQAADWLADRMPRAPVPVPVPLPPRRRSGGAPRR